MKTKNLPAFVPVVPRLLAVLRLIDPMGNKSSIRVNLQQDGYPGEVTKSVMSQDGSWKAIEARQRFTRMQWAVILAGDKLRYCTAEKINEKLALLISKK